MGILLLAIVFFLGALCYTQQAILKHSGQEVGVATTLHMT